MAKNFQGDSALEALYNIVKRLGQVVRYAHDTYVVDGDNRYGSRQWETHYTPEHETGSIYYSSLEHKVDTVDWDCMLIPQYMSFGDYSNTNTAERSNKECFYKQFGETAGVYEFTGDYGHEGVAIKLSAITDEMVEVFKALADYPIMDDEHHSFLEMEVEMEDFDDWIWGDLKRGLIRKFTADPTLSDEVRDIITDVIDEMGGDDRGKTLYLKLKERTNTEWHSESPTSGHVDIDRLVKGAVKGDFDVQA